MRIEKIITFLILFTRILCKMGSSFNAEVGAAGRVMEGVWERTFARGQEGGGGETGIPKQEIRL